MLRTGYAENMLRIGYAGYADTHNSKLPGYTNFKTLIPVFFNSSNSQCTDTHTNNKIIIVLDQLFRKLADIMAFQTVSHKHVYFPIYFLRQNPNTYSETKFK